MRETVQLLENIFSEICRRSFPLDWDEDHITHELMIRLRELFNNRIVQFTNFSKIVHWQSFKNDRPNEIRFGDIALLINIQFTSGEILKGVAWIEAKRSFKSSNFESIRLDQLNRVHSNAPYSHLLLYNHCDYRLPIKFPNEANWDSHFWITPINTAQNMLPQLQRNENVNVLRVCFPFSMFLVSRIFWGHDLDYRQDVYNNVAQAIDRLLNQPAYLGVVNIFYEDQTPIGTELSQNWEKI